MNCYLVKEQRPRALLHAQVFSILNSLALSMTGPFVGMGWVGFIEMGLIKQTSIVKPWVLFFPPKTYGRFYLYGGPGWDLFCQTKHIFNQRQ